MSGGKAGRWTGAGWLALIAVPPLVVVVGLALFFGWQIRKGAVTPKWKAKPAVTNTVAESEKPR
ncbi:MAG: hypothetical protein AB7O66_04300 [Limisphaerales bacterium]